MDWKRYKKELWNGYKNKIVWFLLVSIGFVNFASGEFNFSQYSQSANVTGLIFMCIVSFSIISIIYLFFNSIILLFKEDKPNGRPI